MTASRVATLGVAIAVAACGRIGFDPLDGASSGVRWVRTAVGRHTTTGATTTDTFSMSAANAGDAIALFVSCTTGAMQPGVAVTAPGWSFTPLAPLTGSTVVGRFSRTYGTVAPNTAAANVTVLWTAACSVAVTALADEFTGNDQTGGTTTFDGHAEQTGQGSCSASLTIANAGDAVWAACDSGSHTSATGAGYRKGADDGVGDFAEYKLDAVAGSMETPNFDGGMPFVEMAMTIKPR